LWWGTGSDVMVWGMRLAVIWKGAEVRLAAAAATSTVKPRGKLLTHLEHIHGEAIGVNLAVHVGPKAVHPIALDTFDGHQWSS
jgi:hypothetical protein